MVLWNFDTASAAGQQAARNHGLIACAVFGVQAALGIAVLGSAGGWTSAPGISVVIGGGIELAAAIITALRLRQGRGAYWGMGLAVLVALELFGKAAGGNVPGLLIGGGVLVLLLSGIRGALAARRNAQPG